MQWTALMGAFLASAVEFVEAFTIVLVVGVTINWRSSLVGACATTATLAIIVATFGIALVQLVPLSILRLIVGILIILFSLKCLKKSILCYIGLKALYNENVMKAIYNFIVGDVIILVGVLLVVVMLALINTLSVLAPLQIIAGGILIVAVLAVLVATLSREAFSRR